MPRTFQNFIAKKYASSPVIKKYYKSLKHYRSEYIANNGLREWLETLRDTAPSTQLTISIAKTLMRYGGKTADSMPTVLASISRQYNVELPAVSGILTKEYWHEINDRYALNAA